MPPGDVVLALTATMLPFTQSCHEPGSVSCRVGKVSVTCIPALARTDRLAHPNHCIMHKQCCLHGQGCLCNIPIKVPLAAMCQHPSGPTLLCKDYVSVIGNDSLNACQSLLRAFVKAARLPLAVRQQKKEEPPCELCFCQSCQGYGQHSCMHKCPGTLHL